MPDEDVQSIPYHPPPKAETGAPKLSWQRGEALEEPTLATPLYIQERIHPNNFVQGLLKGQQSGDGQESLFSEFNNLPQDARYRWYQHQGNWSNRLIRGPSQEVMASLLVKDDLTGKVQCIFFDPPYGISFKSLYQASTRSRNESKDARSANAEQRVAFRDSYVKGVHSYLDTIYRIATHARELLTESGSFFMQISHENVHRVALVLDEVFGAANHVATIMFAKSGSTSANALPMVNDYLLWYGKDKERLKYRQMYTPLTRKGIIEMFTSYAALELKDGTERPLTTEEKNDPDNTIPDDARVFRRMPLTSLNEQEGRSSPFKWNGKEYPCPKGRHWSVSPEGLERLANYVPTRLTQAESAEALLGWKRYESEVAGRQVTNLWGETMSPSDLRYVVETAESVITRCICMTTDPGDLVFDPTCGSGTTAYVAERFGRRWITSDVSGISLALTRHRLITGVFEWYVTQASLEGRKIEMQLGGEALATTVDDADDPASGFVYPRKPKVSAAILAYEQKVAPVLLVDQPIKSSEPGLRRVSSPFTVETHSPHRYLTIEEALAEHPGASDGMREDVRTRIVEALQRDGIRLGNGERMIFTDVGDADGHQVLTHRARGPKARRADTCIAVFGPDETVNRFAERRALTEATQYESTKTLLLIGFGFEASPQPEQKGRVMVYRVQSHQDLRIGELAPDMNADTLVVVAEPDIKLVQVEDGKWTLEVRGFDSYDPATGQIAAHQTVDEIECLMIDTDYDGMAFFAKEIHFPGQGNDRRLKHLKSQLGARLDPEFWAICLSTKSRPFAAPISGEVAVRIITAAGAELTAVRRVGDR